MRPRTMKLLRPALILIVLLTFTETPLYAYTDPGSGIMIWQILAAGFIGGLFQFRKLKSWIKVKIQRRAPERQNG